MNKEFSDSRSKNKSSLFAKRIYPARVLGMGLGYITVASALYSESHHALVWVIFTGYCFLWPHLAFYYVKNISDTLLTGRRQLLFDAFCGGIWVSMISFNVLPSAIVITMLSMSNIAAGGFTYLIYALLAEVVGMIFGIFLFGWHPHWNSTLTVVLASLPFLMIYPVAVGAMIYQFAVRLNEQKSRLKLLSRTDGLTGLYNRRYWQSRAAEEFDRCWRNKREAVLLMIDIDHFKSINDQFGHIIGDEVIRGLANILHSQLRSIDICGRFGGEEFSVLLPDIDLAEGKKIGERLRAAVDNAVIGDNTPQQCTVSIGVAEFDHSFISFEDWVNAADQALYEAKAKGRNRVCLSPPNHNLHVINPKNSPAGRNPGS